MFGAKFNHEARFFADGYELSGVDNAAFSYNNTANILKPLGTKKGLTTHSGPVQQTLSLSRVLTYNDPILGYTGNNPISGSVYYDDNYYGFESGYLVDYSLNCAVGSVPRVSSNFQISSEMKSGVDASLPAQTHPPIDIPTQGSISITSDNSTTNRVIGFDYAVKCQRKAYLTIGSNNVIKVELLPPIEYTATVQIDVDDAFLQDSHNFLDDKEGKTVSLSVDGRSGTPLQSVTIPNASLISENLQVSAEGGAKITLNYVGHSAEYEAPKISGDVTYVFAQNGDIYDYTGSPTLPVDWYSGSEAIYGLKLGNNVTSIGNNAFMDCDKLQGNLYVEMPNGSIGDNAFRNCSGFDGNLTIEDGLDTIGDNAFRESSFQGDLFLPNSIDSIGEGSFRDSDFNGNLILSTGLNDVPAYSFYNCDGFVGDLTIEGNITGVEDSAFANCSGFDEKVNFNSSYSPFKLGQDAFKNCSRIPEIDGSNPPNTIGSGAFENCGSLKEIGFNLTNSIGENTFKNCYQLESDINFSGLSSLGAGAFESCIKLENVNSISTNTYNVADKSFKNCYNLYSFTGPTSYAKIGIEAFSGCASLSQFTNFPNLEVGEAALKDCSSLSYFDFGSTITGIGDEAFGNCTSFTGDLTLPVSIIDVGVGAFKNCGFDGELDISGCTSLTTIKQASFRDCNFTNELVLPDSVTSIKDSAFRNNNFTGSLILKSGINDIRKSSFEACRNIKKVYVDFGTNVFTSSNAFLDVGSDVGGACIYTNQRDYYNYVSAAGGDGLFQGLPICRGGAFDSRVYRESDDFILQSRSADIPPNWYTTTITNVYLDIGSSATSIALNAFIGNFSIVGDLYVPSSVTSIGNTAFQNCNGFDGELILNEGLEYIGVSTFDGCDGFVGDLTIPDSLTGMGTGAFDGCTGFNGELKIGAGLEIIPDNAFSSTQFTGNLTIPSTVSMISGTEAFRYCDKLDSLTIEEGCTFIRLRAFSDCSGLKGNLKIPNSVTNLGNSVFRDCRGLESLDLGAGLVDINQNCFQRCTGLQELTLGANLSGTNAIGNNAFQDCSGIQYAYLDIPLAAMDNNQSVRFQAEPTSDKILYVRESYYGEYLTASQLGTKTPTQDGYFQGSILSIWPDDPTRTIWYGASYNDIDSIPGDVPNNWKINATDGHHLYIGSNTKIIGNTAFYSAPNLSGALFLPNTLREIKRDAFSYTKISSVISQEGIETIGYAAFYDCEFLTSVNLPASLDLIDIYAFGQCNSLKNITIGREDVEPKTVIKDSAFIDIGLNTSNGVITLNKSVNKVGAWAFSNYSASYDFLKTLYCNAYEVGFRAFYDQNNLTNLTFGPNCKIIREYAFDDCNVLTSFILPNPSRVEQYAFIYCGNVNYVEIGNDDPDNYNEGILEDFSFQYVGANVSNGTVIIKKSIYLVEDRAFYGNYSWIKTADLNCQRIDAEAFEDQNNLDTVTIRENCNDIRREVFNGCTSLTSINCYTNESSFSLNSLVASSINTIRVLSTDPTWTAGAGQTIGGKANINVIKDL